MSETARIIIAVCLYLFGLRTGWIFHEIQQKRRRLREMREELRR